MKNTSFEGKTALVIGLGMSGLGACKLLVRAGAQVKGSDRASINLPTDMFTAKELERIKIETGTHSEAFLEGIDFAVISPGISLHSDLIKKLTVKDIPFFGEIELASRFCKGTIIGITGSNGKTTTTAWIEHILRECSQYAVAAGNIGYSFSQAVIEHPEAQFYVLELSSFQLQSLKQFTPHIGILLNISPDHLDIHSSMDEYIQAKYALFSNQTERDRAILRDIEFQKYRYKAKIKAPVLRYSLHDQNSDIFIQKDFISIKRDNKIIPLIQCKNIPLPGEHNIENAMAVILGTSLAGISDSEIRKTLVTFPGKPHRLELFFTKNSVRFINDSKATTVDSVEKAIRAFDTNTILIMGGRDKNADFRPLAASIKKYIKKLIVVGESSDKIISHLQGSTSICKTFSLQESIEEAWNSAESDTVILFSPGCTSFDMFANYKERGNVFKNTVVELLKNQ